ncbi:phosphopantetheine-binding protein [bacterium]|nr:phosphopantetheine-binding protein [bacterium]
MTQISNAELAKEVTGLIIEKLKITHVTAEEVNVNTPLFSDENELDLDSIDAIEIVVALQQSYGVRINDELPTREILNSIQTITDFLIKEKATEKLM